RRPRHPPPGRPAGSRRRRRPPPFPPGLNFTSESADTQVVTVVLAGAWVVTATVAVIAVQRARKSAGACEELAHLSRRDPLTGLPNRAALPDSLRRALNASRQSSMLVAAMFADLDLFKLVNDAYGHEVGDRLMVKVAERMTEVATSTSPRGR